MVTFCLFTALLFFAIDVILVLFFWTVVSSVYFLGSFRGDVSVISITAIYDGWVFRFDWWLVFIRISYCLKLWKVFVIGVIVAFLIWPWKSVMVIADVKFVGVLLTGLWPFALIISADVSGGVVSIVWIW